MRNYNLTEKKKLKKICHMIFAVYCGLVLLLTIGYELCFAAKDPIRERTGSLLLQEES